MTDHHGEHETGTGPQRFVGLVPAGDHPVTAGHIADQSVRLILAALTEIVEIIEIHGDMAPTSAAYVTELANIVAGETLAWTRRWPK